MRSRRPLTLATVVVAALSLPMSGAHADISNDRFYANQTPYGEPGTSVVAPPAGYELFFVQNVGRHGARSLTGPGTEKRALAVWKGARRKNALTTRGTKFDDQLRAFQRAEKKLGYGNLSTVGKDEWRSIGRRTASTYQGFFTAVGLRGEKIAAQTSPVYRTKQSANYFRRGLQSVVPSIPSPSRKVNKDLLIPEGSTKAGRAAIAKVQRRSSVKAAARTVLLRLYKKSYVNRLSDPVGKALDVYQLYSTAPGLAKDTRVTFADYVPVSAAKHLAEATDARTFYRFGPGVKGQTSSYRGARPVLKDFFGALDARIAGGSTAAVFRLAHGEVTMPFAALIKAPRSQKQASRAFSYGSNPWRGFVAGRLAGNLEWTAFRNASGEVLVTMRYNEQPVQFNTSCTPSALNPYFYRVSQLKSCLG
ncbi:histidine phosphatase family protein [Aeromicrobium wangtongii]|uniref:histidine phosphatase family protein n=1 Tax=Aeromicrobium wangtongii TaxID=2969247 RepID=UPI00201719B4|nr:histidine phosphatase family protein [Aeromicrobium wangtongii]MCL3818998.1 histidine phosphatase family protein [Aeromicrobium wangtongii]